MTAGVVLVLLVLAARYGRAKGPWGGYLLLVVSLVWLLVNRPMEGAVLVGFTPDHGFTEGDLAGMLGIALGLREGLPDVLHRVRRVRARGQEPRRARPPRSL